MNEVLRSIHSRRSIRKFKPEQFSSELLERIVQAGLYAPSAMNRQPWHLTEFGVPENNHVFACVALGFADGEAPQAPPRKAGTVNYVE